MGIYEDQLTAVAHGDYWDIAKLDEYKKQMVELRALMTKIAGSLGWEGKSADLARDNFARLSEQFKDNE